MKRIAGALALGAGLLFAGSDALANDVDSGGPAPAREKSIEEILAELAVQRAEIDALRLTVAAKSAEGEGGGSVEDAVKAYLESDEGKKLLGKDKHDYRVFWKDGLNFETGDKNFTAYVGGRIHYDVIVPDADDDVETKKATDFDPISGFRRLRMEMGGTIYGNIFYYNSLDFADAAYAYKDNYIGIKGLPGVGNFRVGFFKEPVGLEELTSSKNITMMERSIANNAFAPTHSHGFMFNNDYKDGQFTWAVGDFWEGGTGAARFQHNFSGRITFAPMFRPKDNEIIHLGLSYQDRSPETETDQFRARPGVGFTARTIDTGTISVDSEQIIGLEAAVQRGMLSLQGEYYMANVEGHEDVPTSVDPEFSGWYAQFAATVTGEPRPYSKGVFGRLKPKKPLSMKGEGSGALELAVRVSRVDLDDKGIQGGVANDTTFGINWYLNPNTRIMINYILHHVRWDSDTEGDVNSIAVRFAIDF